MNKHGGRRRVRMRRHDPHNTTPARIQPRRNDPQNHILTRENPSHPRHIINPRRPLHNTHRRRPPLLHQLRHLLDRRLGPNRSRLRAGIHDGGEIRQGSLLTERVDIGEHGCGLGVGGYTASELGLDACEGGIEFLGGGGAAFDLVEGFVEDFGDIEETDDVAFFVADGLL